jgi:zinc transporter ZupT
MTSDFLTNLGVTSYGFAAGASVAFALFAAWRNRAGVVVGAMVAAAATLVAGLVAATPPPGQQIYSADGWRPWLVAVGAGSTLVCVGLVAVWRWKRTGPAGVAAFALGALVIYALVYGSVPTCPTSSSCDRTRHWPCRDIAWDVSEKHGA